MSYTNNSYDWTQLFSDEALEMVEQFKKLVTVNLDDERNINIYIISPTVGPADPCTTCPHRNGLTDGMGRPIIGDSPCEWCKNYKWKITW